MPRRLPRMLLVGVILAWAAAGQAADPERRTVLDCNGRRLVWKSGQAKPEMADGWIRIAIDTQTQSLEVERLVVAGKGRLEISREWLRGYLEVPYERDGRLYPLVTVTLNRFTGEVSIASSRRTPSRTVQRPLLHFVGQCERKPPLY